MVSGRTDQEIEADLRASAERARGFAAASKSRNTARAYRSDLVHFEAWCAARNLSPVPAEPAVVAMYLGDLADANKAFATIRRRLAAISFAHRQRNLVSPTRHPEVQRVAEGIARTLTVASKQKAPMTIDLVREALTVIDTSLRGNRDRAILLLGFAGAFRRSELAALDVEDLKFSRKGLVVVLRRSKTDQEGAGRDVVVPFAAVSSICAVRAVKAWLEHARIESGPVFRNVVAGRATAEPMADAAIARLIKRIAKRAGIDGDFSGHSLRAGFATSAGERGIPDYDIARTTGHKNMTTLHKYIRRGNAFENCALTKILG